MKKTLLLCALVLWAGVQVSFAQDRVVKGRVIDENGEGVPGATVKIKGTNSGSVTDVDGNYEISVPEDKNVLIFSGIGVETQELKLGNNLENLVTTLQQSDDNVITGVNIYGQKVDRKSFTGSVSTVTAKDISRRPVTNVANALEGATPGVAITSTGQPGASPDIQVRGQNTLSANGNPLIVLDGAPYSGTLASINPNDVETMVVLKDASATSIYGSRGANGVILITTKRGEQSDKPVIDIDASVGMINRFMPFYKTLGVKDYLEMSFQAWNNAFGGTLSYDPDFWLYLGNYNPYNMSIKDVMTIKTENGYKYATVNPDARLMYNDSWLKELERTGIRHNYNIAVGNGDKKSDYRFSLGYTNDQGFMKMSNYDRITMKINVNSTITNWLKAGFNVGVTYDDMRFFTGGQQTYQNPFMTAQVMGPIYPVYRYDSLGNRMKDANGDVLYDFGVNDENNPSRLAQNRPFATNLNPIASLYLDDIHTRKLTGFGATYLEAKILKDFNFRTNMVVNYLNISDYDYQNSVFGDGANIGGRMDRDLNARLNYTFNQILTWKPTFSGLNPSDGEGHNLDVVLGHEVYYVKDELNSLARTGFPSKDFREGAAAAVGVGSSSRVNELAMESYFSMLNYNYQSKYFFSASLRADGSSRFSPSSRWGTFGSVGLGWMLSQEGFMSNVNQINMLKVRGSYGVAGNEALDVAGYYASQGKYSFLPNNTNSGLLFSNWDNPNLRWEGNFKFNIGFDLEAFGNRLTATFDYFNSGASNLLFVRPFPPSVGSGGVYDNVGNMSNRGVELQLSGDIVRSDRDGFRWNTRANLTHLRNEITKTQDGDSLIGSGTILMKGKPVNSFFLPHYAGVDPDNGQALYQKADGTITSDYGSLTARDYNVLGSSFRDLEGSLTNTFGYKNFEFYFLVSFGIGGKFYDGMYARLMSTEQGQALHEDALKAWQKRGDVTDIPKLQYNKTYDNPLSDRFLISNSFVNLKTLNLSYRFSAKTVKSIGLRGLSIYTAVDNLFYKSARTGVNVQQDFFGTTSFYYVPTRTVVFGLNVQL